MDQRRPNYHAHFDCFSGAAGDMMLAACLDAADSLPYPLRLGLWATDEADDIIGKNSEILLAQIVLDLEGGLPELDGEFDLTVKRVWRGMGRIAAKKVDVESVYNHEAAPVPGAAVNDAEETKHSHEHKHQDGHDHQHSSDLAVDDEGVKEEPAQNHEGGHSHSHGHSQEHSQSHDHGPDEGHSHDHGSAHNHGHSHDHQSGGNKLRNLPQIKQMLQTASSQHIPRHVATLAIEAFTALAHAEMATHGAESIDQVHFHEVGAVDSIVDTVGTLLALYHLGVHLGGGDENNVSVAVSCSALPLGEGTVWTDHGLLPVPAPATLRLMIGMPTCPGPKGVTGELVTPTAAALLRALTGVDSGNDAKNNNGSYWQAKAISGRPPNFTPRAVGIGAGSKDFEKHPNVIRLILGNDTKNVSESMPKAVESQEVSSGEANSKNAISEAKTTKLTALQWDMHTLTHMQANIDDATPELLAHAIDLLLNNGAIDAWIHPIVMKKGRPAHSLHCICRCDEGVSTTDESSEHRLLGILFRHTTTLGIRIQRNILRAALKRRFSEVQLPYRNNARDGKVDVKISSFKDGEVVSVKAEFDQCRVISLESDVPLKIVSSSAERLAWDNHVSS